MIVITHSPGSKVTQSELLVGKFVDESLVSAENESAVDARTGAINADMNNVKTVAMSITQIRVISGFRYYRNQVDIRYLYALQKNF